MMLLSYTLVDFRLFYDGAVDIQIWALLTKSQCKVSDTQVTVKACGPLLENNNILINFNSKQIFLGVAWYIVSISIWGAYTASLVS